MTIPDHGNTPVPMLTCPVEGSDLHTTLVLALRDMRTANERDPTTGEGAGNRSWIGLALGMIVLDTLTPRPERTPRRKRMKGCRAADRPQGERDYWVKLLTEHGVSEDDAVITWKLRCSLLHGYGPPSRNDLDGKPMELTNATNVHALEERDGRLRLSVPVFCGRLVERIAHAAHDRWDGSLVEYQQLRVRNE